MSRITISSRQGLIKDVRGNVAILFGVALIPILLGVGIAVDYARALMVRERMQGALDAAISLLARGLALARPNASQGTGIFRRKLCAH